MKFYINAIDRETYKIIHGTDNFEKVVKNLKDIYNLKKEKYNNVKISVSYIMTKWSVKSQEEIEDFFKGICDEVLIDMAKNQGGLIKEIDYLVDDAQNMKLPCFYVFNSINITCEGYITACCMDFQNYLAYADINKTSISDAWNNKVVTELRRKHLCNKIEGTICENCVNGTHSKIEPIDRKLATLFNDYRIELSLKLNE